MNSQTTVTDGVETRMVNIHDAKTHLSQLILEASQGKPFIIAKAGKPMVKVTPVSSEPRKRMGMLEGVFKVPKDIDTPFRADIESMFGL